MKKKELQIATSPTENRTLPISASVTILGDLRDASKHTVWIAPPVSSSEGSLIRLQELFGPMGVYPSGRFTAIFVDPILRTAFNSSYELADLDEYIAILDEVKSVLGVGDIHTLIGIGGGAQVALNWASELGTEVESLILNSVRTRTSPNQKRFYGSLSGLLKLEETEEVKPIDLLEGFLTGTSDLQAKDFIRKDFAEVKPGLSAWFDIFSNRATPHSSLERQALLEQISANTLILGAENDPFCTEKDLDDLLSYIADPELIFIDSNTGALAMIKEPLQVRAALLEFYKSVATKKAFRSLLMSA